MKKLLAIVLGLSVFTAGLFAVDADAANEAAKDLAIETAKFTVDASVEALKTIDFPTGTWVDENWNAEWVMDVAKVHLYDATTGEKIYTFTKENTDYFKFVPSDSGISLSFACAETHRAYKITKPLNLETDLVLEIDPDWTDSDYSVNLKFKSVNVPN